MEAASIAARPPSSFRAAVRSFLAKWGLIIVLLIMPVVYGAIDIANDGNLSRLGNNLVAGISNGSIWALVALGYTLVYGIIELINFAHGDLFMIGSFVSYGLFGTLGITLATATFGIVGGLLATLIIAMLVCGLLNVMIERVAYRPLRNAPKLAPLITAVGFSFILQDVGQLWLGGSQQGVPDLIHGQQDVFTILGLHVAREDLLAVGVTVPLFLLLTW
ncbi:MAG: branched-chain amino acid transport system permease protein, partial [Thermoleophilaceae bacterium]|nr:branched-chain amino acid transport system permease protein [Thermoleophilaceae bacterium]